MLKLLLLVVVPTCNGLLRADRRVPFAAALFLISWYCRCQAALLLLDVAVTVTAHLGRREWPLPGARNQFKSGIFEIFSCRLGFHGLIFQGLMTDNQLIFWYYRCQAALLLLDAAVTVAAHLGRHEWPFAMGRRSARISDFWDILLPSRISWVSIAVTGNRQDVYSNDRKFILQILGACLNLTCQNL